MLTCKEKYRKEIWEIEKILNKECGLYKIRPEGYVSKVIHRKNLRPVNWGDEAGDEEVNSELSENEMPDMAEVLGRFGINTTAFDETECEETKTVDDSESTVEVLPELRRSERLRRKRCEE